MATFYASGFEHGSKTVIPTTDADQYASVSIGTSAPNTGVYHLQVAQGTTSNWVRFPVKTLPDEAWVSSTIAIGGTAKGFRYEFEMSDGTTAGIRRAAGGSPDFYELYSGSTLLETGTTTVGSANRHIEMHLSGSSLDVSIDGLVEFTYSGNAKPGSSAIAYVRYYVDGTTSGDFFRVDDLTISDSGAPGDIRYIALKASGDSAVTWTPSTGGTNYLMVDEIPPDDADYVSTTVTNAEDLYTMGNYTTGKTVDYLTHWVRAAYVTSAGSIIPVVKSSSTTDVGDAQALTTTALYYSRIMPTDPATGLPWSTTTIDALLIGQRATVGASVRVYQNVIEVGFTPQAEPGIAHVLSMDVDDENGTRAYVTKLNAAVLTLSRHSTTTLIQQASVTFGACSEAQLAARTFWLGCYTPAFFGTAAFGNYVFVFGRWDDSGVAHLKLSTNGGATFGADLADVSWGTDWVGAFFASSTTTYYAFINGASPGLWRSTNSGTSWTKLSVTPVDVDFGAVSLHADGRLLITSRASGAAQAYYADSVGDYASWTDISGTLGTADGEPSAIWVV